LSDQASYEVRVETAFQARHRRGPDGKMSEEHSHRWQVAVSAASEQLDAIALVVDFRKLLGQTDALLPELESGRIEDHDDFHDLTVTAGRVAEWILTRLQAESRGATYRIARVEVSCDPGIAFIATAEKAAG